MKKTLAVLISIILTISMVSLCFGAYAADDSDILLEGETLDKAIVSVISVLADIPASSIVSVETKEDTNGITGENLAKEFAKYVFVDFSKVDEYAEKVAEDADYIVRTLENGKKTVYISVDFRKHPELANFDVFREAVKKMNEKQKEVAVDGDYSLLTYEQIAGELALHEILVVAYSAMGISPEDQMFKSLITAELNIDETRFPAQAIKLIGKIIMDYIGFTFYTFFNLFKK